jgi:uracil-DNA glycosylase family 4
MTRYQLLKARWEDGCGASICSGARKVFCRGALPCDVLFVGEAPGESEDALGQPFIGPAGKLLDRILVVVGKYLWMSHPGVPWPRLAFANLVGCVPRDEDGEKAGPPCHQDIRHCSPRLRDIVDLARPRLIVAVGTLARDYLDRKMRGNVWETDRTKGKKDRALAAGAYVPRVDIVHPAAILRANEAQQGLMAQRAEVQLVTAFQALLTASE